MMLHIDRSQHRWFRDGRYYELIAIMDDATSEIYYAQLAEAEYTRSVMNGPARGDRDQKTVLFDVQRPGRALLFHAQTRCTRRSDGLHAGETGLT
jgi:hypothetical protein